MAKYFFYGRKAYPVDDLKEYLSRKQKEENSILEFMITDGINERQARIIKLYKDKPNSIYTAKELVSFLGVTEKTVRTDLEGLVKCGLLERIHKNRRLVGYTVSVSPTSKTK